MSIIILNNTEACRTRLQQDIAAFGMPVLDQRQALNLEPFYPEILMKGWALVFYHEARGPMYWWITWDHRALTFHRGAYIFNRELAIHSFSFERDYWQQEKIQWQSALKI